MPKANQLSSAAIASRAPPLILGYVSGTSEPLHMAWQFYELQESLPYCSSCFAFILQSFLSRGACEGGRLGVRKLGQQHPVQFKDPV